MGNRQTFSSLAVILMVVGGCLLLFGEIILHPSEFLFNPSGDGLKNYFSVAYQVVHGKNLWFEGMLYPYGDHLVYADGQPLLTKALSIFLDPEVENGRAVIASMNLLMIFSLVITSWCIHRILILNHVNLWFAVPFSIMIAFLSPQIARFAGHYALAYTFFVPMSWLLIFSLWKGRRSWTVAVLLSAVQLAFAFLHPYYLFLFTLFVGTIVTWEVITSRFQLSRISCLAAKIFALIVPLAVFMIYQWSVDPYSDRPTSPAGIYGLATTFQSVFFPVNGPIYHFINPNASVFTPGNWEGHAYIGLMAGILGISSLFPLLRRWRKRRWKVLTHPVLPPMLKLAFVPAIITLLFSMGLFHRLGLEALSEWITPIKQFRSLGRVAWIFYYVFSVWAVFRLYVLFRYLNAVRSGRYKWLGGAMMVVTGCVWSLDAFLHVRENSSYLMNPNAENVFSMYKALQWTNADVNLQDHQAIVPLPMKLIGSEKIGLENGQQSLALAMQGAFSTGLPIVGGTMSRTSLTVTEKTAQLVSHPLFPRPILNNMRPREKLLLLRSKEPLTKDEKRLTDMATLVFQDQAYTLYSISPKELKEAYTGFASSYRKTDAGPKNRYQESSSWEKGNETLWGALTYRMGAGDHLVDSVFRVSQTFTLSYWLKIDPDEELLPTKAFFVNGKKMNSGLLGSNPNLLDGWLFITEDLQVEAGKRYQYGLQERGGVVSRIQLRSAEQTHMHDEGDRWFVNNIPVP